MDVWKEVVRFDPTLALPAASARRLRTKQVQPSTFSLKAAFEGMAAGEPRLFEGLWIDRSRHRNRGRSVVDVLDSPACRRIKVSIRSGPTARRQTVRVSDLMKRWRSPRGFVSVTDFHIRGTAIERAIDTEALSHFNMLCRGTAAMAEQEMMTMVISSKGWATDSHSDDPDGSNHCFLGSKLWLVWDTFEGRRRGLQDVERDEVFDRASFDMTAFLSLKSSRWFVVSAGQTLFLPGQFTHKVITLEPYLGVGSFYVSIPNCVPTIGRWMEHGPLWSLEDKKGVNKNLLAQITATALTQINTALSGSGSAKHCGGLPFLAASVARWKRVTASKVQTRLLADPLFRSLVAQSAQVQ
jgi:hypothetical protein